MNGGSGSGAFTLGNIVVDKLNMTGNSGLTMILNPQVTFQVLKLSCYNRCHRMQRFLYYTFFNIAVDNLSMVGSSGVKMILNPLATFSTLRPTLLQ